MAFGSKNRVRAQVGVEGVKESVGELGQFRKAFDDLAGSKGAQAILGGVGLGAGVKAFDLLERGIGAVVEIGGDAVNAASNLRESMTLANQVFGEGTAQVEDWAEATEDAFSKREALDYLSQFGNLLQGAGIGLDESIEKSKELTTLAGDLGSAFNTSSAEAADAIKSGLIGESEPLRRFGVLLSEGAVKAEAMALGLAKGGAELTDGEKALARYSLIMKGTTRVQGTFGEDTESLADAQKLLTTNVEDLEAKLGEKLVPALADAAESAADFAVEISKDGGALDQLLGFLGGLSGESLPGVVDAVGRVNDETLTMEERLKGLVDETIGALPVLGNLIDWGWDTSRSMLGVKDATEQADRANQASADRWEAQARRFAVLDGVADDVAGRFAAVRDRAAEMNRKLEDAEERADDVRDAFRDLADELIEGAAGQDQLTLKIQAAKLELGEQRRELRNLEAIKNPTKDQQADMVDLRLRVSETREDLAGLYADSLLTDGLTLEQYKAQLRQIERWAGLTADEVARLYRMGLGVQGLGLAGNNPKPGKGNVAFAAGGFAEPGSTIMTSEEGPELMHLLPGGGAQITPRDQVAGSGSWGRGAPVVIQLVVDGRVLAEIVDNHLAYEAARAPQSPYSG